MDPKKKARLEAAGFVVCDTPEELFAHIFNELPDTGITKSLESNEAAEDVAAHPETWVPIHPKP
jgi:hypothetical protein